MNYESPTKQDTPEEAQRRELINQIISIYCELPTEKCIELLRKIKEIKIKNQAFNEEIADKYKRMSVGGRKLLMRFITAMFDGDVEELKKIKAENPDIESSPIDKTIVDIEAGKPARHQLRPIPSDLPANEKLPILIHNINRLAPADCDTALAILSMGTEEVKS